MKKGGILVHIMSFVFVRTGCALYESGMYGKRVSEAHQSRSMWMGECVEVGGRNGRRLAGESVSVSKMQTDEKQEETQANIAVPYHERASHNQRHLKKVQCFVFRTAERHSEGND